MDRSHALSEKAIKRRGLDKQREENPLSKEVVKEWATEQEYWDEWEKEIERRITAMSEDEKNSMSEGELHRKVYMEVWDGSGIEGWYD